MAFRGRGRGRGGGRRAKELPFDLFPEIEGLGTAKFSPDKKQLIKWSSDLHRHSKSSPYFYVDPKERNQGPAKLQKPDIERFSDKESVTTKDKSELLDFISLDPAHFPGELASKDVKKTKRRKIQWNLKTDDDLFEKLEKLEKENDGEAENKENEEEEEEEEDNADEDEGEMSDEHDYEQNRDFDDDEDDYNAVEEDDEPIF